MKTLEARKQKKREFVMSHLIRAEAIRDPLEKQGGCVESVKRERQALKDLEERQIAIRSAIQKANHATSITVEGQTRTIQEWLTWRKEVATGQKNFLAGLANGLKNYRAEQQKKGVVVVSASVGGAPENAMIVSIDEGELGAELEKMELVLGTLDGQLSLKNATITIDV